MQTEQDSGINKEWIESKPVTRGESVPAVPVSTKNELKVYFPVFLINYFSYCINKEWIERASESVFQRLKKLMYQQRMNWKSLSRIQQTLKILLYQQRMNWKAGSVAATGA